MVFDIYDGRHIGQRKIPFKRNEMELCLREAEQVLAFSHAPFKFGMEVIEYGPIKSGDEVDPIAFYNAIRKSFHMPARVWDSLALHEAIHARMDAEGLLLTLIEPDTNGWATYGRVIDETMAELGVNYVYPLNPDWFLRNHTTNVYDSIIQKVESDTLDVELAELIEREQGEPVDAVVKRWYVYSEAINLVDFHRKLELEYARDKDQEKLNAGIKEV